MFAPLERLIFPGEPETAYVGTLRAMYTNGEVQFVRFRVVDDTLWQDWSTLKNDLIPFGSRNTSDPARRDRFCSLFSAQTS